jgi:hypothetical protein
LAFVLGGEMGEKRREGALRGSAEIAEEFEPTTGRSETRADHVSAGGAADLQAVQLGG